MDSPQEDVAVDSRIHPFLLAHSVAWVAVLVPVLLWCECDGWIEGFLKAVAIGNLVVLGCLAHHALRDGSQGLKDQQPGAS